MDVFKLRVLIWLVLKIERGLAEPSIPGTRYEGRIKPLSSFFFGSCSLLLCSVFVTFLFYSNN